MILRRLLSCQHGLADFTELRGFPYWARQYCRAKSGKVGDACNKYVQQSLENLRINENICHNFSRTLYGSMKIVLLIRSYVIKKTVTHLFLVLEGI